MRICYILFSLFLFPLSNIAQTQVTKRDTLPKYGNEPKSSAFFREVYLHNDLAHYLDNLSEYVTYLSETTGSFNLPDKLLFSVSGNSYRSNKYYLDGFRIDNRFSPGSTPYVPDLYSHSIDLDYKHSVLNFSTDSILPNSLALRFNIGGLGGISPSTKGLINLFHKTASERMYKPILFRDKMREAGTVSFNYTIPRDGKQYTQQFYADFGTRMVVGYDEAGINGYEPENFTKVQLAGQLPIKIGQLFDRTNYLTIISQRQNLYNEFNYGIDETAHQNAYSFSFYGNKERSDYKYTSGFTLANNKVRHGNLNFSRNLIDQDGEAFEPWCPDGNTTELSHSLNYTKKLSPTLELTFDSYNSLMHFSPTFDSFQNSVFVRKENVTPIMEIPFQSLYVYDWKSKAFTSGLLENTISLKTENRLSSSLNFKGNVDLTFDGMLISSKSMYRPNWQARMGLSYRPNRWFSTELNLSRNRVSFNFEDTRYFSNEYMNADVYYWNDNGDRTYQPNEKSNTLFTTTGGAYHQTAGNLRQQSYFVLDLPFHFRFGHHEFSLLNTYKKYFNNWTTRFDKPADQYGSNTTVDDKQIFYFNRNTPVNYVVDYYPESFMKMGKFYDFATNTPYYGASTIKYQYSTEKLLFSVSWCSYLMSGISTLGNGPLHNNIGVYSETSANPNTLYKLVGRLDQERAYVARILLSYQLTKRFNFALSGKFKDGQPFTTFDTKIISDANGNNQLAMWNNRTKGINPMDGDFGSREDAFFNIDLRTTYSGNLMNHPYEIQMMLYNVYDFGTELTEYTFEPDNMNARFALDLNIPRGLMITAKIYL
jgi:hypothetical protein